MTTRHMRLYRVSIIRNANETISVMDIVADSQVDVGLVKAEKYAQGKCEKDDVAVAVHGAEVVVCSDE